MFRIRPDHLQAFCQASLQEFEERTAKLLREFLPEQTQSIPHQDLVERVRRCVPRAQKYGLTTEKELTIFASVSILLGDHFDQKHSWAARLLQSIFLSPEEKVDELAARAWAQHHQPQVPFASAG